LVSECSIRTSGEYDDMKRFARGVFYRKKYNDLSLYSKQGKVIGWLESISRTQTKLHQA